MKKTRGMMADVANDPVNYFLKKAARSTYISSKGKKNNKSGKL
jgi:hypothetical protein